MKYLQVPHQVKTIMRSVLFKIIVFRFLQNIDQLESTQQ